MPILELGNFGCESSAPSPSYSPVFCRARINLNVGARFTVTPGPRFKLKLGHVTVTLRPTAASHHSLRPLPVRAERGEVQEEGAQAGPGRLPGPQPESDPGRGGPVWFVPA